MSENGSMFIWLVKFAHTGRWLSMPVGVSEIPERAPFAGVAEFVIYVAM
jgi:hypothetical protein